MAVVVVVPTLNERDNLQRLAEVLLRQSDYRLLIVDDASSDGTAEVADALAARSPGRVIPLHRVGARGLGRSYADAFAFARSMPAQFICQMDADFSHDPDTVPQLVAAAADCDLVIGSRYVEGASVVNWPRRRIWISRFANSYVRTVAGITTRDCTSGFRCWRSELLGHIDPSDIQSNGYAFQVEMLIKAVRLGGRIREVPIVFRERERGVSKLSRTSLIESAIIPWQFRRKGHRPLPALGR
jgi:dolichol-phosphate mannosyltransferase